MSETAAMLAAVLLAASPGESSTQTGYANVNGVRMYYEVHGSGRPVVLLHGGLDTIEKSFSKVLPGLAARYRVVAVEQVGHGHSPDSPARDAYSYAQMADDTAAFLEQIKVERADVIGWSDGARVALLLASRHAERVRRVVMSGISTTPDGFDPKFLKWLRERSAAQMADEMKEDRIAYESTSPDGAAHWPVVVAKVRTLWLNPLSLDDRQVAAVSAPVLIIAGDRDSNLPEHQMHLYRTFPNAQMCVLPGTGHGTFIRRADWLMPMVYSFLDAPEKTTK